MLKRLLIVLFIAGLAVSLGYSDSGESGTVSVDDSMCAIVEVFSNRSIDSIGTGFYIGDDTFVTAKHVADFGKITKVRFEDGEEFRVLKTYKSTNSDCALLIVSGVKRKGLTFDEDPISRGDKIYVLGNPEEFSFLVTEGIVAGWTNKRTWSNRICLVHTAVTYRGSSGSPVLDAEGEVIGVHVAYISTYFKICVSKDAIKELIDRYRRMER